MKIAFAGLRHGHIFALYEMAKNHSLYEIVGSFEDHPDYIASAEKQGVTVNYKTLDELVNDPSVEAVAIGSCFGDRGSVAIEALKHGKNVICDKPLCTSLEELYEIERLAKERGLFVSCMYTMRFEKNMVAVRELIRSGAQYLHKHFAEDVGVEELSAMCNISSVYFRRLFKEQTGMSPTEYRTHLRLVQGAELLRFGTASVSEISDRLGFVDSAYFAKIFKEKYGVTPLAYRKHSKF